MITAATSPPEGQLLHRLIEPLWSSGRVLATTMLATQCTGARQIPIKASMGLPHDCSSWVSFSIACLSSVASTECSNPLRETALHSQLTLVLHVHCKCCRSSTTAEDGATDGGAEPRSSAVEPLLSAAAVAIKQQHINMRASMAVVMMALLPGEQR